jgi:hypothetical protein
LNLGIFCGLRAPVTKSKSGAAVCESTSHVVCVITVRRSELGTFSWTDEFYRESWIIRDIGWLSWQCGKQQANVDRYLLQWPPTNFSPIQACSQASSFLQTPANVSLKQSALFWIAKRVPKIDAIIKKMQ